MMMWSSCPAGGFSTHHHSTSWPIVSGWGERMTIITHSLIFFVKQSSSSWSPHTCPPHYVPLSSSWCICPCRPHHRSHRQPVHSTNANASLLYFASCCSYLLRGVLPFYLLWPWMWLWLCWLLPRHLLGLLMSHVRLFPPPPLLLLCSTWWGARIKKQTEVLVWNTNLKLYWCYMDHHHAAFLTILLAMVRTNLGRLSS